MQSFLCKPQTKFLLYDTHERQSSKFNLHFTSKFGARGGAVVEALRYKPEGRGIDFRWCYLKFSLT
jgi:hypothetical protein